MAIMTMNKKRFIALLAIAGALVACSSENSKGDDDSKVVKASSMCGNNSLDLFEACDGTQFSKQISISCPQGTHYEASKLKCDACVLDWSEACVEDRCGDGRLGFAEECESGVAMTNLTFACEDPDEDKLECVNCKFVDHGVCGQASHADTNKCNNGRLDAGEICDGAVFADGIRKCPAGRIEIENPIYKCTSTCTSIDISGACVQDPCGNGQLDEGEQCDINTFDPAEVKKIDCGDGKMLYEKSLVCNDQCQINAQNACINDKFLVFSEIIPTFEKVNGFYYLGGLALEVTDMDKKAVDVSTCAFEMADGALETLKTWNFADYGVDKLGAHDPVVFCIMPEGSDSYGDACDVVIPESSIKTVFAKAAMLAITCGGEYIDIFNLVSFSEAINAGGVDFTRHCDVTPISRPEEALIGDYWTIDPESEINAPEYGLGEHCSAEGAVVSDCKYTVSANELTSRSQVIDLTFEVKIPGLTDVTNKTDASNKVKVAFMTGTFDDSVGIEHTIHHRPVAKADADWTNDNGIDRYVGKIRNWDTYDGFFSYEQGKYTLDAAVSFDNGTTWTYCGPKGVIKDPTEYVADERNLLNVSYGESKCGNNILEPGEVCDGKDFIEEQFGCFEKGQIVDSTADVKCASSCESISGAAVCADKSDNCGNDRLDAGEVCDGSDFDDEKLAELCNDEQTYVSGRATCSDACRPSSAASCISKDYAVLIDELFVKKRADDEMDIAFRIVNKNESPVDLTSCNLAYITNDFKIINNFVSFARLRDVETGQLKNCESIVVCSQNVDNKDDMTFSNDICTANLPIAEPDTSAADGYSYVPVLDFETAGYLQLTCGGQLIDYVNLNDVRKAVKAGKTHFVLGEDQKPWPDYMSSRLDQRMTSDASFDLTDFAKKCK